MGKNESWEPKPVSPEQNGFEPESDELDTLPVNLRIIAPVDPEWMELAGRKLEQYRGRFDILRKSASGRYQAPELHRMRKTFYQLEMMSRLVKDGEIDLKVLAEEMRDQNSYLFDGDNYNAAANVMLAYTEGREGRTRGVDFLRQRVEAVDRLQQSG